MPNARRNDGDTSVDVTASRFHNRFTRAHLFNIAHFAIRDDLRARPRRRG